MTNEIHLRSGAESPRNGGIEGGNAQLQILNGEAPQALPQDPAFDIAALRRKVEEGSGREYWKSLDELAGTPEFQALLEREFPEGAAEWNDPVGRRHFMKLMGASVMLAGIGACTRQPEEKILPYVKAPEQFVPGRPIYFATAMPLAGYGTGLLVESHTGRPTKIEGNPDHPASLGATDSLAQASILQLYDPDRSQTVRNKGTISNWSAFSAALTDMVSGWKTSGGAGLRILTETVSSPTLAAQIKGLLARYPQAQWIQYDPVLRDNAREGGRMAFGQYVETTYRFGQAEVVLSVDADFLMSMPGSVRYARDFTAKRKVTNGSTTMNRLYALECAPTVTGATADHRRGLAPSALEGTFWRIAADLGVSIPSGVTPTQGDKWTQGVVRDLKKNAGKSIVLCGDHLPASVHAACHAINAALGNAGGTVVYTDPVEAAPQNQTARLKALAQEMEGGGVSALVVIGCNPAFTAPVDLKFSDRLRKVKSVIHMGLYSDETAYLAQWHIPALHYLEDWSDVRAFDGTVSIVQPLIAPMYYGHSAHELLALMAGESGAPTSAYDIVRATFRGPAQAPPPTSDSTVQATAPTSVAPTAEMETAWSNALHDGVVAGTSLPPISPTLNTAWSAAAQASKGGQGGIELVLLPDPTIYDGRFANLGWLQELPKPMTLLTWENALLVAPSYAEKEGLRNGDVVKVTIGGNALDAPIWITPGQPVGSCTLHFGYGRVRGGRVANGAGVNAYALRTTDAPWGGVATIKPTGECRALATTQSHHSMEGRDIVRAGTVADFATNAALVNKPVGVGTHAEPGAKPPDTDASFYPDWPYQDAAWGMTIDLTSCIGCNACMIACQSENNIAVVGKEQVLKHREMHWIRVDRYYSGNLDEPRADFQPIPCMQCENAPCEPVCPVGATVHSDEGLNDMAYNRCVGTRYCSNNCPYKVRRFNYLLFSDLETESIKLGRNPDVTVRSRGVMEKCTYCTQRISHARIEAKKDGREVADGEIITACQQVCPTEAIAFGNINDPKSRVAAMKKHPLNYSLLEDLNTRPRTTYLARLRNPNPELEGVA